MQWVDVGGGRMVLSFVFVPITDVTIKKAFELASPAFVLFSNVDNGPTNHPNRK